MLNTNWIPLTLENQVKNDNISNFLNCTKVVSAISTSDYLTNWCNFQSINGEENSDEVNFSFKSNIAFAKNFKLLWGNWGLFCSLIGVSILNYFKHI